MCFFGVFLGGAWGAGGGGRGWDNLVLGEGERYGIRNTEILFNKAIAPFEGV